MLLNVEEGAKRKVERVCWVVEITLWDGWAVGIQTYGSLGGF